MASDLPSAIVTYRAGLEAELGLLKALQRLATQLQAVTRAQHIEDMTRVGEERERVMASQVALEAELKPIRLALSVRRAEALSMPGFDDLMALHRSAAALVTSILSADEETVEALREAEIARRLAAQAIETGESTLSAYRRVITPQLASAALVDRHG
jgi:hypothetical protein